MQEHIHMDFIYFGFLKDYKKVSMIEEYRWCTKKDLKTMKLQFEVARLAPQAIDAGKRYYTQLPTRPRMDRVYFKKEGFIQKKKNQIFIYLYNIKIFYLSDRTREL